MDDFPIIDPHHHLYDLENHRYPWLQDGVKPTVVGDYSSICRSYLLEHFLADCKNQKFVKSVHVDVGFDPNNPVGETEWLQSLANECGYPHGIVGYANLAMPNVRNVLERHLAFPNFRGIRQSQLRRSGEDLSRSSRRKPRKRLAARLFVAARPRSILRSPDLLSPQMEEAHELHRHFRRYADHPGPHRHAGRQARATSSLEDRACSAWLGLPTLLAKSQGLEWAIRHEPSVQSSHTCSPLLRPLGVDRCVFTSNFPVDKLFSSYDAIIDAFKKITIEFSRRAPVLPMTTQAFWAVIGSAGLRTVSD